MIENNEMNDCIMHDAKILLRKFAKKKKKKKKMEKLNTKI